MNTPFSILIVIPILIPFTLAQSSHQDVHEPDPFVRQTCARVRHSEYCIFVFDGFHNYTLDYLAKTAIIKTGAYDGLVLNRIKQSKNETKDPILLKEFDYCIKEYEQAVNVDYEGATSSFLSGDYKNAAAKVYHAVGHVRNCDKNFKGVNPYSPENERAAKFAIMTGDLVSLLLKK